MVEQSPKILAIEEEASATTCYHCYRHNMLTRISKHKTH